MKRLGWTVLILQIAAAAIAATSFYVGVSIDSFYFPKTDFGMRPLFELALLLILIWAVPEVLLRIFVKTR
jgi:hypothetical protein